jgi:hypothetical protein
MRVVEEKIMFCLEEMNKWRKWMIMKLRDVKSVENVNATLIGFVFEEVKVV